MATELDTPRVARARANALGLGGESSAVPRRRRGRIAAGMTLLIVSGWLAAVTFVSVGSRREVLALAQPVGRFEELTRQDLRVVRVATDPEVEVVSAERLDALVGRVAATDLAEGSLVHEGELLDAGDRLVGADEAIVGTVLAAEDSPGHLASGTDVEIVVRAPAGSTAGAQTLRGWVRAVEDADTPGIDSQRVSLVVPADSVALVSAAAAEDRVSIAVLGGP